MARTPATSVAGVAPSESSTVRLAFLTEPLPTENCHTPRTSVELSPYGGQVCTRDSSDSGVLLFVVDGRHLAEG